MNSQTQEIRKWLEDGNTLTAIQALQKFNCFRCAARIADLRNKGMDIITKTITRGNKSFAEYSMKEK